MTHNRSTVQYIAGRGFDSGRRCLEGGWVAKAQSTASFGVPPDTDDAGYGVRYNRRPKHLSLRKPSGQNPKAWVVKIARAKST